MIILSIGSDRNLFIQGSDAQNRIKDYGKLFEQLHIIVFSNLKNNYQNIRIDSNIFIYPTNHIFKVFYLYKIYKIAKSIGEKSGFSVITAQDPFEAGLAGWILKVIFKKVLQIQIHTDVFSPYFRKESFLNKLRVILAKFLLPRADGIRVVSERIKRSLISNFQFPISKISVLPIFVDIEKIRNAEITVDLHKKYPQYDFIILMASRLTKEKNIGMAIESMRGVVKKYPKTLLLIAGDGPELNKLKVKSEKLKVNNVIFESWTNDLISYYKTANLFLLTSNYEGYGRTVIEAMAAGLPVVMTDVGLAGEILIESENGLIVPINNRKLLEEKITDLMGNIGKISNFKKNNLLLLNRLKSEEYYLNNYKKMFQL